MSQQLPCIRTHVTALDLYSALGDELENVIGKEPMRESVLCLVAQWGIETGGSAACWCWNLTNIRHVDGDGRDWTVIPSCSEIVNGHEIHYNATDNPEMCEFRAYATLAGGVTDYVATLQRRFTTAWAAMLTGDPRAFGLALHVDRFYTADPVRYTAALTHWYRQLDASLPSL